MQHIAYDPSADAYPIALLVKDAAFSQRDIDVSYTLALEEHGINKNEILALPLPYNGKKTVTVPQCREHLKTLMPQLDSVGVKYVYCADATYFKALTSQTKADPHLGYVMKCSMKDYEHMNVVYGINHHSILHNPANGPKLSMSLVTLAESYLGTYKGLGTDIVHAAHYPETLEDIEAWLTNLHQYPDLVCDIEAFSLDPFKAGVGTITFSWDQNNGVAFLVDWKEYANPPQGTAFGYQDKNQPVRDLLKAFFETYTGTLRYHRATYDIKVLVQQLWMTHHQDYNGMLIGIETLTENFDCTLIIAYLAINSCAGNDLSLKELAHSFAGNWAEANVNDIRKIPKDNLLRYNLVDGLSTNYVYDTYYPKLVADNQLGVYEEVLKPSVATIVQMELVGMPMDPVKIAEAKLELQQIVKAQSCVYDSLPIIADLEEELAKRKHAKDFADRKAKAKKPEKIKPKDWNHFPRAKYNPGSGKQTQVLLYELMGLPVIDRTKTKQPAVGAETLEKLVNHCVDPVHKQILEALVAEGKAQKILSTFIPAFENGTLKRDKMIWLHGCFNIGGTLSGRLSSSDPNMQNLPSGSKFGKLIKKCFVAPKGWIFCGADFASLEDRINALITKDPNKLKVYTDGYDGHSLRTYAYWPQEFTHLSSSPKDINSIADTHEALRSKSKGPTFALTYLGTWVTLMNNAGFSKEEAQAIEDNFHKLYGVSRQWVEEKINRAANDGYTTCAFGLRVRTPLLKQTLLGHSNTPREAEAEARSMGNAVSGQSYGMLTNRAANAVMQRVRKSPYRFDIMPVAMIHDAIYFIVRDQVDAMHWLNEVLIEEMAWQELPEIQHDIIKLEAELDIYYPSWAHPLTLPNKASPDDIYAMCVEHAEAITAKE